MTVLDSHRSDGRNPVVVARYGFPHISELRWLGPDYAALLVQDLQRGLLRQDSGTRLRGVRCEADPRLRTVAVDRGALRAQDVAFALQLLLSDGRGRSWRLRGRFTYCGRDLGTARASVTHFWELFAAELV